jgi:hypothetical protein
MGWNPSPPSDKIGSNAIVILVKINKKLNALDDASKVKFIYNHTLYF